MCSPIMGRAPCCHNALVQGQVCWGFLTPSRVSLCWRSPAQLVCHDCPVNAPLSGPAAELFEESGDGFCVAISRQRYL